MVKFSSEKQGDEEARKKLWENGFVSLFNTNSEMKRWNNFDIKLKPHFTAYLFRI